jgi:hypothetical protein
MGAPQRLAATSETQLHIGWAELTAAAETGGAPVSSYGLEWDAGSGGTTWAELAGLTAPYPDAEYVVTSGVTPGGAYSVRVRAFNAHGWGPTSPTATIVASAAPDQMDAPTTALSGGVNVRVSWTAADANSDPVDAYEVQLATTSGSYAIAPLACDGAGASALGSHYCEFPLLSLRAAPYSLVQGAHILAQVRAHNSIGWGPPSDATDPAAGGTAALLEVEPQQMAAPTRGALTSTSQVHVEWAALTAPANGGASIDSYHLEWDSGSGGTAWDSL